MQPGLFYKHLRHSLSQSLTLSHVTCDISHVTCHVSLFFFFFGLSGEAYRWRVCYQRGLPRLVSCITQNLVVSVLYYNLPFFSNVETQVVMDGLFWYYNNSSPWPNTNLSRTRGSCVDPASDIQICSILNYYFRISLAGSLAMDLLDVADSYYKCSQYLFC